MPLNTPTWIATPELALSGGEILRLRLRMTGSEGARSDRGLSSGVGTYRLLVGKVFHSKAEVAQNSCQGAFRNVTSALGNGSEAFVHGVPPDFMGAGTLSDKLAVQLAELPGQHSVGHTGTRSST